MTVCATPACRRDTARPGSSDRFALCPDCTEALLAGRELASTPAQDTESHPRLRVLHSGRHPFWARVDASAGDDACWPWLGQIDRYGYGRSRTHQSEIGAHRVAFEIEHGSVPPGMEVMHRCDNPPCCNPGHLVAGTHAENMADRTAKGRAPVGSKVHNARLDERRVQEIKRRLSAGATTYRLGKDFAVSAAAIRHIRDGKTWTHVRT